MVKIFFSFLVLYSISFAEEINNLNLLDDSSPVKEIVKK